MFSVPIVRNGRHQYRVRETGLLEYFNHERIPLAACLPHLPATLRCIIGTVKHGWFAHVLPLESAPGEHGSTVCSHLHVRASWWRDTLGTIRQNIAHPLVISQRTTSYTHHTHARVPVPLSSSPHHPFTLRTD